VFVKYLCLYRSTGQTAIFSNISVKLKSFFIKAVLLYLFVYCLFSVVVCTSDYIASNDMVINE
jgi:hypothetical protein